MQHEPSPAAGIAAALGARAEAVCRRYLPHGRKLGRYWVAGDLDGARGRSLFVRLSGSGTPGKWTDAATGEHGDLLDLIRHRTRAPSLRAALDEARAFLALPTAPATGSGDSYDATEAARRLWRQCRAIGGTHAERYLHARGLSRCRFAALRYHPELRYREGSSVRRFPALVAAVTGNDGAVLGVQRTWLHPRSPAKAGVTNPRKALGRIFGHAVRFGAVPGDGLASLVVGEGIETVLSLIAAVPEIDAAAALSAGTRPPKRRNTGPSPDNRQSGCRRVPHQRRRPRPDRRRHHRRPGPEGRGRPVRREGIFPCQNAETRRDEVGRRLQPDREGRPLRQARLRLTPTPRRPVGRETPENLPCPRTVLHAHPQSDARPSR